jgi:hypothetical protein
MPKLEAFGDTTDKDVEKRLTALGDEIAEQAALKQATADASPVYEIVQVPGSWYFQSKFSEQ